MTEWTEEETSTLLKLWKEKPDPEGIAKKLNKTSNSVTSKINRLGHGMKVLKRKKNNLIVSEDTTFTRDLRDSGANECRYMEAIPMICGKAIHKRDMCQEHYDLCYIMPKSRKETDAAIKERIATAERNERSIF